MNGCVVWELRVLISHPHLILVRMSSKGPGQLLQHLSMHFDITLAVLQQLAVLGRALGRALGRTLGRMRGNVLQ